MDPDELYTLRAQFWLGHFDLCLAEGKSLARRPMSPNLKLEREEFLHRANIALGKYSKVISETSNASGSLKALHLHASYEAAASKSVPDTAEMDSIVNEMKSLLSSNPSDLTTSLQLTAAHVFLRHNLTREALQCVHLGTSMEHIVLSLQIYLKIDRLDLAAAQLSLLKQADEESVLTQLGSVFYKIATGKSGADDALHTLNMMTEQYGTSTMLSNLTAVVYLTAGNFSAAERVLLEAKEELETSGISNADTWINLVVCASQMGKVKEANQYVMHLKSNFNSHPFVTNLERVENAFDRESLKYVVGA